MKYIFIDANIFLEVQLEQKNATDCTNLLLCLEKSPLRAWTNSFLVYSMLMTLLHKSKDVSRAKTFIQAINSYKGLRIFHPGSEVCFKAVLEIEKHGLDFDDSLVIACMKKLGITDIVTYDEHFKGLKDINVISPLIAIEKLEKK